MSISHIIWLDTFWTDLVFADDMILYIDYSKEFTKDNY